MTEEVALSVGSSALQLPALIDRPGKPAAQRFLEFFTGNDAAKLSPDVMVTVERQFAPEHQGTVTQLLATYGQLSSERDVEPVHKAILQVANGNVARGRSLVDLARRDYRDVLAWASRRVRPNTRRLRSSPSSESQSF